MKIPDNTNPEEHADTVWEEVIKPCQAEKIVIISHSYGGVVTMNLARGHQEDFLKKTPLISPNPCGLLHFLNMR